MFYPFMSKYEVVLIRGQLIRTEMDIWWLIPMHLSICWSNSASLSKMDLIVLLYTPLFLTQNASVNLEHASKFG